MLRSISKTVLFFIATIMFSAQMARAQGAPKSDIAPSHSVAAAGAAAAATPGPTSFNSVGNDADSVPDGTVITMQNWQNYRQFMPDGMAAFFEGRYFWKMPADVQMPVGPTIIHPLPSGYMEATEKYSAQVKVV